MTLALKQRLKAYGIVITGLLVLSVYLYIIETAWDEKRPDLYEEQVGLDPLPASPVLHYNKALGDESRNIKRIVDDLRIIKEELDGLERIQERGMMIGKSLRSLTDFSEQLYLPEQAKRLSDD